MKLDDLYKIMKMHLSHMYEEGDNKVIIPYDTFMELYKLVCYIKQIKKITDDM